MAKLITDDALKDALTKFRERGDERWASFDGIADAVSEEMDARALTEDDMQELLADIGDEED